MGRSNRVRGAGELAIARRGGRGFLMGGAGRSKWALRLLDSNLGGSEQEDSAIKAQENDASHNQR